MNKINSNPKWIKSFLLVLSAVYLTIAVGPGRVLAGESHTPVISPYGRAVGNGGDILICRDSNKNVTGVKLLDHYEAETIRGVKIDFGVAGDDLNQRLAVAFSRLERFSPERSEKYSAWAQEFFQEAQFLRDIDLVDIPDSQHIVIPRGCEIQQIANQATTLVPGQKRYTIDLSLWELLNADQKAGLILHEVVYREALALGQTNSVSARFLSSLMASPTINQYSQSEFVSLLQDLGFTTVRIQGVLIQVLSVKGEEVQPLPVEFYRNGRLRLAQVVTGTPFLEPISQQSLSLRGQALFHENGVLAEAQLAKAEPFQYRGTTLTFEPQAIRFHPNGALALAVLRDAVDMQTGAFDLRINGHIQFYPTGALEMAKIDSGQWRSPAGVVKLHSLVALYENGGPKALYVQAAQIAVFQRVVSVAGAIEFYPTGAIQLFTAAQGELYAPTASGKIRAFGDMPIELYPSGAVKRMTLARQERLKTQKQQTVLFEARVEVVFDENGFAI